jgi:hypothetical protein
VRSCPSECATRFGVRARSLRSAAFPRATLGLSYSPDDQTGKGKSSPEITHITRILLGKPAPYEKAVEDYSTPGPQADLDGVR